MLLISKYKMTYSIEDYLSDIPLQQGKKVEMSLLAEQITTGEEERQAHLRSSVYDISVLITVDGREYALPLAKVMKANRRGIAYGTKQEELYDVSTIVRELGLYNMCRLLDKREGLSRVDISGLMDMILELWKLGN